MGFKFDGLHPQVKEAVALWEAFSRLGFDIDEIGAGIAPDGQAIVTLHHLGDQFNIFLGQPIDLQASQYVGRWREAVQSIIADSYDKVSLETLLNGSRIWGMMDELIKQLLEKGFLEDKPLARLFNQ